MKQDEQHALEEEQSGPWCLFSIFFNPNHHWEFLGYGGKGHQIQTTRPYNQYGKDIPIWCTLNSKIASAEGFPRGTYDRNATNIQIQKATLWGAASHLQQPVDTRRDFLYHSFSADCSLWLIHLGSTASPRQTAPEAAQVHPHNTDSFSSLPAPCQSKAQAGFYSSFSNFSSS